MLLRIDKPDDQPYSRGVRVQAGGGVVMRFTWLVALAVILAFVWVGVAGAAPTKPAGGDPDIWERAKINNPSGVAKPALIHSETSVVVDLQVFKVGVSRQDVRNSSIESRMSPLVGRTLTSRR
jgi:hypothetical protein